MGRLFFTTTVDAQQVASEVRQHWALELGNCIKASQNHTFLAQTQDGTKFVVRVTPNPLAMQKIVDEITFVQYVAKSESLKGQVCKFVAPITAAADDTAEPNYGKWVLRTGELLIVVSEFAKGEMLDLANHSWMFDHRLVEACGRWLGSFHVASAEFCKVNPVIAARIQRWDEVHDGVMHGVELHESDKLAQDKRDPKRYGILHGDVNCSNFFYTSSSATLSMFDWDQVEQGWFLYDLAQPIFAPYLFSRAQGTTVNVQAFTDTLVAGYESVMGKGSVDRAALSRMLMLRRTLYDRFCRRALREGEAPPDMKGFLEFIVSWLDREKRQQMAQRVALGTVIAAAALKMFFGRSRE